MARKLRIAASVFFGLLTIALCLLWVRSYWWHDRIQRTTGRQQYEVTSNYGWVEFVSRYGLLPVFNETFSSERAVPLKTGTAQSILGMAGHFGRATTQIYVAHRCLIMLFAVVAVLPWLMCSARFSLRTLLIATTLVAVVLGLGVWLAR